MTPVQLAEYFDSSDDDAPLPRRTPGTTRVSGDGATELASRCRGGGEPGGSGLLRRGSWDEPPPGQSASSGGGDSSTAATRELFAPEVVPSCRTAPPRSRCSEEKPITGERIMELAKATRARGEDDVDVEVAAPKMQRMADAAPAPALFAGAPLAPPAPPEPPAPAAELTIGSR